jgi:hypothetical protein
MVKETGKVTSDVDFFGDKLYLQRAREALPILVRQAMVSQKITYTDLARELNMPNPRNLNFILGAIGNMLVSCSKQWKEEIPPIQSIVVKRDTDIPGDGVSWFIKDKEKYKNATPSEKRMMSLEMLQKVFHYGNWLDLLEKLNIQPNTAPAISFKGMTAKSRKGGTGESEQHKTFKKFISENPLALKLKGFKQGDTEHTFPSADTIDVYFPNDKMVVGVEVKSVISDTQDIMRGLFQCKKYEALIEAENSVLGIRKQIKVILVLEGIMPPDLLSIKNILSVNVMDNLKQVMK